MLNGIFVLFNWQNGAKRPKRVNSAHGMKLKNSYSFNSNDFNSWSTDLFQLVYAKSNKKKMEVRYLIS